MPRLTSKQKRVASRNLVKYDQMNEEAARLRADRDRELRRSMRGGGVWLPTAHELAVTNGEGYSGRLM